MLKQSRYRHRYRYAVMTGLFLVLASTFILLNTFVFAQAIAPIGPVATPSPTAELTPAPLDLDTSPAPTASAVPTVYTDTHYSDGNLTIDITRVEENGHVYFVADIKMNDLKYFKTAFAKGQAGRNMREATSVQARNNNAILAINGDYYGFRETGLIIRNGTLYRDKADGESLVLMNSGEMRIVPKDASATQLINEGALQSWSFGPALVIDGVRVERESSVSVANPRTGIGMIDPLHYIFIVAEGRLEGATGLKMKDFGEIFVRYGAKVAYNLDGGGTSTMVMNNKLVNRPTYGEERNISDIIYIGLQ